MNEKLFLCICQIFSLSPKPLESGRYAEVNIKILRMNFVEERIVLGSRYRFDHESGTETVIEDARFGEGLQRAVQLNF